MGDPHDSIRAALDYDVIIRDALYGVPSGAVNDLVERLVEMWDDSPPPADAGLLALANRTLAADLETVRAERDRLARVLAVECGDTTQVWPGWTRENSLEWNGPGERWVYRSAPGRWVWASGPTTRGEARTAFEAMESADRAGGADV